MVLVFWPAYDENDYERDDELDEVYRLLGQGLSKVMTSLWECGERSWLFVEKYSPLRCLWADHCALRKQLELPLCFLHRWGAKFGKSRVNPITWLASKRLPSKLLPKTSSLVHELYGEESVVDVHFKGQTKVLRVLIKGNEQLALPDSGAERNILSETFALEQGLKIRRNFKSIKPFILGNGKRISSLGKVYTSVEIPEINSICKKQWFYVLASCPVPLIMGIPFLKETEILTTNKALLEDFSADMGIVLLLIGAPRHRISTSVDGHDIWATADTGSELNLISPQCAKKKGFKVDKRRQERSRLQVGDGSETETIGTVTIKNLIINSPQHGEHKQGQASSVVFHVLPGLPIDMIFSRSLLDATNAFEVCPDLFSTTGDEEHAASELNILISRGSVSLIFPISRRKRCKTDTRNEKERHDEERHAEIFRRSEFEDANAKFPSDRRQQANAVEEQEVQKWDRNHANCVSCHPA